ncbi:MAG: hypothetical protein KUG69_00160 [Marinosulfonomonas sp.]|nr:hypothetical protein [Marinosulfonomonas sp.]
MTDASIYQIVKDKLIAHGVERTNDGLLTLNDQELFSLFVDLERAARDSSFDAVLSAAAALENYLVSIGKHQLMAFTYMYLKFSDFSPKVTGVDEDLHNGRIRKCQEFSKPVSDEERLIGLWATVKFHQVGRSLLRAVYNTS